MYVYVYVSVYIHVYIHIYSPYVEALLRAKRAAHEVRQQLDVAWPKHQG